MREVILIVNPSSGGEKAKEYEKFAKQKLGSLFDTVKVQYTKKSGDAKKFAREAAENHYDSVIVMGGDGTVNEGISGIAEQDYRPNFGFFPLGTVNDLARALDIPLNPQEAIENFSLEKKRSLDVGKINRSYFMNVVAIGTIPEAIHEVESEEKTKMGPLAYLVAALKELIHTESHLFKLVIDGKVKKIESSTLVIGLTNSIGGFEQLLPKAKVDDGKLHLFFLRDSSFLDTIKTVPDLLKGVHASTDNIEYHSSKHLMISLIDEQEELFTNIDGDKGEKLPIEISILPSHLVVYGGK